MAAGDVAGALAITIEPIGGLVTGADGIERGTPLAVNGGIPAALVFIVPLLG